MYYRYILPMYYGAAAKLFEFAKAMRNAPTPAEEAMWSILCDDGLKKYKFRRQHPIATFIADFYCHELKLVIEVDGDYHLQRDQLDFDNFRDSDLNALDISVLRFNNSDALTAQSIVMNKILNHIKSSDS